MNLIDFNPQAPLGLNTNGVHMVYEILNNSDSAWLTQSTSSVCRWACAGGNGYFAAVAANLSEEDQKALEEKSAALMRICSIIAEHVKKDYDISFVQNVEKTRTTTVKIPRERKVGLFKKETYYVEEPRTEKYYEKEDVTYKGWRLERLFRQEGNGSSAEKLFLDYCLGTDGKLYMIASEESSRVVLECVCYSPAFLRNPFCNVYSAAISGVLGALDAIPTDANSSLRNVHIQLDDDYYYNFPIQIDDVSTFSYSFLDGTLARVVALLDEEAKKELCEKYEWMNSIINSF